MLSMASVPRTTATFRSTGLIEAISSPSSRTRPEIVPIEISTYLSPSRPMVPMLVDRIRANPVLDRCVDLQDHADRRQVSLERGKGHELDRPHILSHQPHGGTGDQSLDVLEVGDESVSGPEKTAPGAQGEEHEPGHHQGHHHERPDDQAESPAILHAHPLPATTSPAPRAPGRRFPR